MWDRSPFSPDIRTFWYIVSKNSNRFNVTFTDWWIGGLVFWIFVKIHWLLGLNKRQYCFVNISATKAGIFMKFNVEINYYLVNLIFKLHEHPCTNSRTRVVKARTRDKMGSRMFTTHALAFIHGSLWILNWQDSNWPPHKISWRSKLSLRRYLQNNTDICLILNIQCIFTNI